MEIIVEALSVLGALAGSAGLGVIKTYTTMLDGKVGALIRPVQPLVVLAASAVLPLLGNLIGVVPPDAAQFVSAPVATLVTVAAREVVKRFKRA